MSIYQSMRVKNFKKIVELVGSKFSITNAYQNVYQMEITGNITLPIFCA